MESMDMSYLVSKGLFEQIGITGNPYLKLIRSEVEALVGDVLSALKCGASCFNEYLSDSQFGFT